LVFLTLSASGDLRSLSLAGFGMGNGLGLAMRYCFATVSLTSIRDFPYCGVAANHHPETIRLPYNISRGTGHSVQREFHSHSPMRSEVIHYRTSKRNKNWSN
jgi:hypothetical protein